MNAFIHLFPETSGVGHLYMYISAIVGTVLILTAYGYKRKLPFAPWFLIIFSTIFFAILGGKMFAYSSSEWRHILTTFEFPASDQKRLLGYFLFGLIGFFVTKRVVNFQYKVGDAFAFAWPVGLIITRFGCLIGGCCYGTPTNLPFGITYGQGSSAFSFHQHTGLVTSDAVHSLAVHPVPLYEIAFCLVLLAGLFLAFRRRWFKQAGSLFYLSLGIYGIFRFFEEFIRPGGAYLWGVKTTQIFVIALSVIMFTVMFFHEKRKLNIQSNYDVRRYSHRIIVSYFILTGFVIGISNWLTASEIVVLRMFSLVSLIVLLQLIYEQYSFRLLKSVPLFLTILALIFMSQTFDQPSDSTIFQRKYFKIGGGFGFGHEEEICGSINPYSAGGLSIEHTNQYSKYKKFTVGSQFYGLNYDEAFAFGLNPYVNYSGKIAAVGIGLNYTDISSEWRAEGLTPTLFLRLGPEDIFFADMHYGTNMPAGLPSFQMGLGVGLKRNTENYLRFGISNTGFYFNPHFMMDNSLSLDPYFSIASSEVYHFGFRLNYRIFHE